MDHLLTFQYYFNIRPDADFRYTKLAILLAVLLFLFGILLKIYRKKYAKDAILKKILKRYPGSFFMFGFILLCLLLFREAGIPYLSMKIWWLALFVYMVYWGLKMCFGFKKEYNNRKTQMSRRASSSKYIPRKKK